MLYDKNGKPKIQDITLENEINSVNRKKPELLECEILTAIKELNKNKAVGSDQIPTEFLQVLEEKGPEKLKK